MELYITIFASVIFALCHIMITICSRIKEKKYRIIADILFGIMVVIMIVMTLVDVAYLIIYMPYIVIALQTKNKHLDEKVT